MSKKILSDKEIKLISKNKYVKSVSEKGIPGKVLLTDVTYLKYGGGKTAYLSTILDAATNEVIAYSVTDNLKMPLVLDTLKKLKQNKRVPLHPSATIHSDQGSHYTSPKFQKAVKKMGNLKASMSRKGNCWIMPLKSHSLVISKIILIF